MPIDDHRSRTPARPVIDEADDDVADRHPPGEPNPTPERLAEIETAQIAEAVRRLDDYRAGREEALPWGPELEAEMFGPLTPEELAEYARERARR